MKLKSFLFALPLTLGIAMAQTQTTPATPQSQSTPDQSTPKNMKSDTKTSAKDMKEDAKTASNTALPEMKTSTYKGVLVDMSCASASSGAASGDTKSTSANREDSKGADCPVSANSSQFGLKMDDGRTVKFDLVGNQRAQDAVKNDKGWNKELTANKPLKVKVNGALNGDKLIVSSIH